MVKDILKITQLIDFYGCLLTEKQISYLTDYYFNDLTLSEIGEKNNISKNAIFDSIKKSINDLEHYESKLNLIKGFNMRVKIYDSLNISEDQKKALIDSEVIHYGKKY